MITMAKVVIVTNGAISNRYFISEIKNITTVNHYFTALSKYSVSSGRASRAEFWTFLLFNILACFIINFAGGLIDDGGLLARYYRLAVFIPSLAVGVRRMHDTNHSGWWLLCPIVNLIFALQEGHPENNRFGPNPEGAEFEK